MVLERLFSPWQWQIFNWNSKWLYICRRKRLSIHSALPLRWPTLHELKGSGHVVLPGADEADKQTVRLLPKGVLHPLGQVITSLCLLLNNSSQLLHCRHLLLIRLVQLVLGLQGEPEQTVSWQFGQLWMGLTCFWSRTQAAVGDTVLTFFSSGECHLGFIHFILSKSKCNFLLMELMMDFMDSLTTLSNLQLA